MYEIGFKHLQTELRCPPFCGFSMCEVCHEAVLRGRKCPRCQKQFLICASCDRGHVYCGRECSRAARRESRRKSQRHYRRTEWGRENHQDSERDRRRRRRNEARSVGVRSSGVVGGSVRVTAPVLCAAAVASRSSNGVELRYDDLCCNICGRPGRFVRFGGNFRQEGGRKRPFRMLC